MPERRLVPVVVSIEVTPEDALALEGATNIKLVVNKKNAEATAAKNR